MMRRAGPPLVGTVRLAFCIGMAAMVALGGCDPWEGFADGDDSLGPVDPVVFPAANLGGGGNRLRPGLGVFQEAVAYADGAILGYFPYLYPSTTSRNLCGSVRTAQRTPASRPSGRTCSIPPPA